MSNTTSDATHSPVAGAGRDPDIVSIEPPTPEVGQQDTTKAEGTPMKVDEGVQTNDGMNELATKPSAPTKATADADTTTAQDTVPHSFASDSDLLEDVQDVQTCREHCRMEPFPEYDDLFARLDHPFWKGDHPNLRADHPYWNGEPPQEVVDGVYRLEDTRSSSRASVTPRPKCYTQGQMENGYKPPLDPIRRGRIRTIGASKDGRREDGPRP